MGKKSPKAPDTSALIDAQTKANQVNQYTPGGTIEYGSFDENGVFKPTADRQSVQVNESDAQKALRTGREGLAQALFSGADYGGVKNGSGVMTPKELQYGLMNVSQFRNNLPEVSSSRDVLNGLPQGGDISTLRTDYGAKNDRAANAVFERGKRMITPDLDLQQQRKDAELAARGIPIGSDAYRSEQDRLSTNRNAAVENLGLSAITAGNQEAGRLFGQDATTFQAGEGQRQARANEGFTGLGFDESQRGNRLNEQVAQLQAQLQKQGFIENVQTGRTNLAAALGTGNPMFVNPAGVDAAGIMQQGYQNQLQAQQQRSGNILGLGGLGAQFGGPVGGLLGAGLGGLF